MKNRNTKFTTTMLLLACFALMPAGRAVIPPPDGGYTGANTAEGQAALLSLDGGSFNTAVGFQSLRSATMGSFNTAIGAGALLSNTTDQNTATGAGALLSNTTGGFNTANGAFALLSNTTGNNNTAIGRLALEANTTGANNTANGFNALFGNTTGNGNTADGDSALALNGTGDQNTGLGVSALGNNVMGDRNTAVGAFALTQATSNLNTALGFDAGLNVTTAGNVICIGANVAGANVSDSCFVGNIYQKQVGADSLPVRVDSFGKLGTEISSRRFKRQIRSMASASETILALKPVIFQYKSDRSSTPQFGLVAEDVAEVNPDLVVCDRDGKPYSVRYEAVNAMLLNEFLKEHRKVQEQEATIAVLKKEMDTVVARLNEQDSKIEGVSAPVKVTRGVGQTP